MSDNTDLKVHLLYDYDPQSISHLKDQLNSGISVTVGEDIGEDPDYHVLVGGRPSRHQVSASPNLHILIIPWVGVPPETRELLREYPQISVHNLHHNVAPTAETAVALLLAAAKFIIPYDQKLREHDWTLRYKRPGPAQLLMGKTILILGYGTIGKHVAKICNAFGMNVIATKRKPQQTSDDVTSEIHPPQAFERLLPRADFLMICLPLTSETDNLITEKELALLPDNAILINIGRGPIVNEAALYHALKTKQLYAAGIDVWYNYPNEETDRENTPVGNYPFHELENVVMSPHRGGDSDKTQQLRMVHLARLLNAIKDNDKQSNKVDLTIGY